MNAIAGIEPGGDQQPVDSFLGKYPLKFLPPKQKVLRGVLAVLEFSFL